MKRLDIKNGEVADLYLYGFSQPEIGVLMEASRSVIWKRLKAYGVQCRPKGWRKRGGAYYTSSSGYMRTYDREQQQAYIHRGCWEAHNGPIPNGNLVHHVDGDSLNNEIENLACMTKGEHTTLHCKGAVQ